MGIENTINYCWFGKGEIPEKEQKCIESWKKYFPNYKFVLWNETNFDVNSCNYVSQAYERKKYAFVSDYARAKILYENGGIYFDTDFKVLQDFSDIFNDNNGVLGFERKGFLGTAIIGCLPHDPLIKKLLEYYESHDFVMKDGNLDITANVTMITDIFRECGLRIEGGRQHIDNFEVFNREFFYPKKLDENNFRITEDTVGIHMCSNSWLSEKEKRRGTNKIWIKICRPLLIRCRILGIKLIGKERIRVIENKVRNYLK